MDLRDAKSALRREIRTKLRDIPPSERERLDAALFARVTAHPRVCQSDTLLCYVSTSLEPDTRRIIASAWERGQQTAFPVCTAQGEMQFCLAQSWDDLVPGAYGIPEPSGREVPVITDKTVCIVPGYAFTADGKRLGKGGGYYDRFLAAHPEVFTLGLTYAFLLQAEIPCEPHDIGVNAVITDRM